MKKHTDVHSSVNVYSAILKADRKAAGFTQAALAAACGSVSLATIRRAEQGRRIIISSLRRIAAVLNQDHSRYITPDGLNVGSEYVAWIEGEWIGFFVEADRRLLPYIVTADISITQNSTQIEGRLVCTTPTGKRLQRFLDSKIQNSVLSGFTTVDSMVSPNGLSTHNQVISRNNDWFEGYTAWYDTNSRRTEVSRTISVKKSSQNFDRYIEEARFLITRELTNYRMRKLVEAGYHIKEAVAMLTAIEDPVDTKG